MRLAAAGAIDALGAFAFYFALPALVLSFIVLQKSLDIGLFDEKQEAAPTRQSGRRPLYDRAAAQHAA